MSLSKNKYLKELKIALIKNNYSESEICYYYSYAEHLANKKLPVIFDILHLSLLVGYEKSYILSAAHAPSFFYKRFKIPKKTSGYRDIESPLPSLKEIQEYILKNILYKIKPSKYAKGFIPKKNTRDSAKFHVNQKKVLSLDFENFFPSLSYNHVYNIYKRMGYTNSVSGTLTGLSCLDGRLPQGAPTSPYLSNLILKDFDNRVALFCKEESLRYTRYADDLTFSGNINYKKIITFIEKFIKPYNLTLNRKKTKIMKKSQRQLVNGVVVNHHTQGKREDRKKIRQEIYFIKKYGLASHLEYLSLRENCNIDNYLYSLLGRIAYLKSLNKKDKELSIAFSYIKEMSRNIP